MAIDTFYTPHHKLHATDRILVNNLPFISEELPERAELILAALQREQLGAIIAPSDHGLTPILKVHHADFITYLQHAHADWVAFHQQDTPVFPETFAVRPVRHKSKHHIAKAGYYCFGTGTPIISGTWSAAYWSAQCAITGAEHILAGNSRAYALCRPPGHHASIDMYGGFCYLNNAAIAARHLNSRVAILDIDYHHGNGTQEIFYREPNIFFCSLHAHPDDDYPYYWGSSDEHGEQAGEGYNLNLPLPQKTGNPAYLHALDKALDAIAGFAPTYLIISLGLDIALGDPVGGFDITPDGFHSIGGLLAQLKLPTLIVQEGGYLLEMLDANILAFLTAFE